MEGDKMSEKSSARESAGLPDYQASVQSDEIDLVGLWLFFWDQRKMFFSSVILIAVVGIVGFKMFYEPKSVSIVHSIIGSHGVVVGGEIVTTLSPDTLAKQIEYVDLPRIASEQEYNQIKSIIMATKAVPIKGTNMVEITSEVPNSAISDVTKFQDQLVEELYSQLKDSWYSSSGDVSGTIYSLNRSVISLRRLMSELDQELRADAESQDSSSQSLRTQPGQRRNYITTELDSLSIDLKYLESALTSPEPRILVRGQVSGKTVGMKSSTAYSLIIVLAFFLAIFIVVGAAFVSKVQDRMAGRG
jgi:hypothetical protein